jgi:DNA mismatch repair protein MutS
MAKKKHTPLMQQYFEIKSNYKDTLLFFQVGDFYELFFEDAKTASSFLAIALTKRGKNQGKDIPLCGIPVHALNHYLRKLIAGGFTVALCDQLTKPKPGTVVERGVTQVFTPGTLTDSLMLDDKTSSYIMSCYQIKASLGLIFSEILTAQLFATSFNINEKRTLETEITRFSPDEIIIPQNSQYTSLINYFTKQGFFISKSPLSSEKASDNEDYEEKSISLLIEKQFSDRELISLNQHPAVKYSLTHLLSYLQINQKQVIPQFKSIKFYKPEDYLILDAATQKNLEITKTNQGETKNSLFFILDKAKTAMGSRIIKKWLSRPLIEKDSIIQRQKFISSLHENLKLMHSLEELLSQLTDIERIVGRMSLKKAVVQDYIALKNSLVVIPKIKSLLNQYIHNELSTIIQKNISNFDVLHNLLHISINDDHNCPYTIKKSFDLVLDQLRDIIENSQQKLNIFEKDERKKTHIGSLKVRYNNITGYYIEITNTHSKLIPQTYIHQQTLVNRKRFTTATLKALEQEIIAAQHNIQTKETEVFIHIKNEVEQYISPLRTLAHALSYIDGLMSFATVAYNNNYCKPEINTNQTLTIEQGRHPIVETITHTSFTGNDTLLNDEQSLLIITGPNMGGKSTYLRQVALISIMAQCGSFVPAKKASIPIFDRIFTRIGSGDNLMEGKSTFLIEMEESANICLQSTNKSLIILDEVGRGTSTSDGLAIAQAIIEYIVTKRQPKCLFATHYHELTNLAKTFSIIQNYSMQCKKIHNTVHFTHKILLGCSFSSFGIEVAELADLPKSIIQRARELLKLQKPTPNSKISYQPTTPVTVSPKKTGYSQKEEAVINAIETTNLDELSPRQAFELLYKLQKKLL